MAANVEGKFLDVKNKMFTISLYQKKKRVGYARFLSWNNSSLVNHLKRVSSTGVWRRVRWSHGISEQLNYPACVTFGADTAEVNFYNSAPLRLIPFAGKRHNRMLYEWFVVEVASWSISSDWAGPKKISNRYDIEDTVLFERYHLVHRHVSARTLEYRYYLRKQTACRG